jgi:hypothetical protein
MWAARRVAYKRTFVLFKTIFMDPLRFVSPCNETQMGPHLNVILIFCMHVSFCF